MSSIQNSKVKTQKLNSKLKTFYFLLLFLPFAFCLLPFEHIHAQTMENGMYVIEEGDVSTFDSDSYISNNNNDNPAPNKPGEYSGTNYTVKSGADFNQNLTPLTFSISNLSVDFGILSPTNPVLRSLRFYVKDHSAYGYKVTGAENKELTQIQRGTRIPDTTCDTGKCTQAVSAPWESTLTYGFGYRCDGSNANCVESDESFNQKNYFKQFSDTSTDESAATILSGGPKTLKEASITFKVNISSSQPQGIYSNIVTFLAVPGY